jgi:transposase-like protein
MKTILPPTAELETAIMLARHPKTEPATRASITARQRFHLLERYNTARASGQTATAAARDLGSSATTLWRWHRALSQGGLPALAPQTARCGRTSVAETAGLDAAAIEIVRRLAVALASATLAWSAFAGLPQCPPKLARKIRRAKTIPPSLRNLAPVRRRKIQVRDCGGNLMLDVQS